MIRSLGVIAMAAIVWTTSGLLYSGEQASPRALVDKAIKAHGGEANLAKYPAFTMKGSGTFYGLGEGIPYNATWIMQGASQQNVTIEVKVGDMAFKFQSVINGAKGWLKNNDDAATEPAKDELAEEQEKLYAGAVARLTPLKDKSFELALVGEAKVGDRPVVGVRVSKKGHRDVNLYFDKKSGLLLKFETPGKDIKAGQEFTQTTIFEDYKDFKGIQRATKVLIQRDGKRYVEAQITELELLEKLDESAFKKP